MHELSYSINSFATFWEVFKLPIFTSLIGAVIGHYKKNGVIQFPIIYFPYEQNDYVKNSRGLKKISAFLYTIFDFTIFVTGIRTKNGNEKDGIIIDLGFVGDLLIGVGAGILAKSALSLSHTQNEFAIITTSLLAGCAGLSYIKSKQIDHLDVKAQKYEDPFINTKG